MKVNVERDIEAMNRGAKKFCFMHYNGKEVNKKQCYIIYLIVYIYLIKYHRVLCKLGEELIL